tara:strand:- start:2645 stop:3379 length:735 start_codon:yes stop_codon:yes gene_type:complete
MKSNSSIPWIEQEYENHVFDFEKIKSVSSDIPIAASCYLNSKMLLNAYRNGVFPWSGPYQPILWWRPEPRMTLDPTKVRVSKSLKKYIKRYLKNGLSISSNRCFRTVILACAETRERSNGTWITNDIISAYMELNKMGYAHSIEVWLEKELVGGLYLVSIGKMIFGESMFFRKANTSKIALITLSKWLQNHGGLLIDCQQETAHLASMGAAPTSNKIFMDQMKIMIENPPLPWFEEPISEELLT